MTENNAADEWQGETRTADEMPSWRHLIGAMTLSIGFAALVSGKFSMAYVPMLAGGLLYWRTGSVLLGLSPWILQIIGGIVLRLAFEMGLL